MRGLWKLLAAKIEKRRFARELLVALGAVLGASWGRLGAWIAVLGGLGALLGRLKIHAKIDQNFDASWDRFLEGFGSGEPKWSHVGTQIDQKSMPIAKSDFSKNRALPAVGA